MKILILTALYPPIGGSGHDERCRHVVRALSTRGHRLQVLTSNYRVPPMGVNGEQGVFRQCLLHAGGDEETALGTSYRATYEREFENASVLLSRMDQFSPDVVYVWNMRGLSKSLLFSLQERGVPLFYDLHSDWLRPEEYESDPWFRWWRRNKSRRSKLYQGCLKVFGLARRSLRHFPIGQAHELDLSNASVTSVSLRDELVAAGLSQAASLPIIFPALNTNQLNLKESYQPVRKFIWAGRLAAGKGPSLALAAVGILKARGVDVSLDFYGMGEPRERKAMRGLINQSGLADSVQMIGIRPGELVGKYADYDALLFTSRCNDPFPMTPVEAMLSGLPCVVARDGGLQEVVEDGETALLCSADDVDALADAMMRMMDLEDGGEAMSKKCMERLHQHHSLATMAPTIESLLSEAVEPSGAANVMPSKLEIPGVDFDQSVPVMDREQIDLLLMVDDGGDDDSTALVRELFELFKGESANKLKGIEAVCAANDSVELRRIVHFIAGSAGNMGLAYLSALYRAVEYALDQGTITELSPCAAPLRTAFEEACVAFGAEFDL